MCESPHCSFDELKTTVAQALRTQHPDWIANDGSSEKCADYEARFSATFELVPFRKSSARPVYSKCSRLRLACLSSSSNGLSGVLPQMPLDRDAASNPFRTA